MYSSLANNKGRMYSAPSSPPGIQSRSNPTSVVSASMNTSSGISGMHMRCALRFIRVMFAWGRKMFTRPSGDR